MAWDDEHAPISLQDMGLREDVRLVLEHIEETGTLDRHLFLYGPPGTGKTSAAHLVAQSIGAQIRAINASDAGGVDDVRELKDFARTFAPRSRDQQKVVILDEAEGLSDKAARALRNIMSTNKPRTRFIFTTNFPDKMAEGTPAYALVDRCTRLNFTSIPLAERVRVLQRALRAEGHEVARDEVEAFAAPFTSVRSMLRETGDAMEWHGHLVAGNQMDEPRETVAETLRAYHEATQKHPNGFDLGDLVPLLPVEDKPGASTRVSAAVEAGYLTKDPDARVRPFSARLGLTQAGRRYINTEFGLNGEPQAA